jgi:hypothetical protein
VAATGGWGGCEYVGTGGAGGAGIWLWTGDLMSSGWSDVMGLRLLTRRCLDGCFDVFLPRLG